MRLEKLQSGKSQIIFDTYTLSEAGRLRSLPLLEQKPGRDEMAHAGCRGARVDNQVTRSRQ